MNNVWNDLKQENQNNFAFVFILLFFATIPFQLVATNVSLGLFVVFILINYKKITLNFSRNLVWPIALFVLMLLSLIWTIDRERTLKALPKEVFLLIFPLFFVFIPKFSKIQLQKILKYYSYIFVLFSVFYLLRAIIRFIILKNTAVFFYHEEENDLGLISKELNAIHFSVFTAMAYLYFLSKEAKSKIEIVVTSFLLFFLFLLSSKNIILIVILLTLIYIFYFSKSAHKMRLRNLIVFVGVVSSIAFFGKIKHRFQEEFQDNTAKSLSHNVIRISPQNVHNISIYEAWNNEKFYPNAYFPGTAFRVYQARLFLEFLNEEPIFWKGFGLNASYLKIEEKGKKYDVFLGDGKIEGYQNKNFHNQYLQNFAELGIFGLLLLLTMLFVLLKKAIRNKDFTHFAFSILMISVFLTESFLWRQRGVVFFTLFYCLFVTIKIKKEKLN